jgi:adenosylcobinamide kinase/adenosylcobinamide-phosphate guanylyltransferase
MGKQLTLLLGGARSGKSSLAQQMGQQSGQSVLFVATAAALDAEMAARISAHRAARPSGWQTLEAQSEVGRAIRQQEHSYDFLVLDCITLLVSNCLVALPENTPAAESHALIVTEIEELIAAYAASSAEWIIVSNEVGMGLVPPYPLGRVYRDELGYANQRLTQAAGRVALLVAGLPLWLKGAGV